MQAELLTLIRKDRVRRTRRQRFGKFLGDLIVSMLSGALGALLGGWMIMLAVQVAHDHWVPQLPTIGYWWAVLICWLLRGTLSPARPSKGDAS